MRDIQALSTKRKPTSTGKSSSEKCKNLCYKGLTNENGDLERVTFCARSVPHTRAPCDAWLALHSPYAALKPPAHVPRVSARCLVCPSLTFPTSFCHLYLSQCLMRVAPPGRHWSFFGFRVCLPLVSMCVVCNIPSCTLAEPAPVNVGHRPAPWPDRQRCVAASSSCSSL